MIYKLTEWQGGGGNWYCACLDKLGEGVGSGNYHTTAHALGMETPDLLLLLKEKYNANIGGSPQTPIISWEKQADMRKFKNWANAQFRMRQVNI